jgi:PAS domain S-box-containing protein
VGVRSRASEYFGVNRWLAVAMTDRGRISSSDQMLAFLVESSHDAIISKDLNGIVTSWNRGAERLLGYTADEIVGLPVTILIPPNMHDEDSRVFERLRRGEFVEPYETVRTRKDGSVVHVLLTASPIWNAEGQVIGVSKIAHDITEFKHARDQQALLIGEMKHRVNNLVTVLEALGRGAIPKDETATKVFFGNFMGRVRALLSAGEMVVSSSTHCADLCETAQLALRPFVEVYPKRIHIRGPALLLGEKTIAGLALAFHELATNALKYGALATEDGTIELSWTVEQSVVTIVWKERVGFDITPSKEQGFGSRLIKAAVSGEQNGQTEIRFAADGLKCVFGFTMPS